MSSNHDFWTSISRSIVSIAKRIIIIAVILIIFWVMEYFLADDAMVVATSYIM